MKGKSKNNNKNNEKRDNNLWLSNKKISKKQHTQNRWEGRCMCKWQNKNKKNNDKRTHKNTKYQNSRRCSKKMVKLGSATKASLLINWNNSKKLITPILIYKFLSI